MKRKRSRESTREQWMLGVVWAGVINANNAPFCSDPDNENEQEEINRDPGYVAAVGKEIAERTSKMAVEDAIEVLEAALSNFEGYEYIKDKPKAKPKRQKQTK